MGKGWKHGHPQKWEHPAEAVAMVPSGRLANGQELPMPLPQGDRPLTRLGPQQRHLAGRRQQHMNCAPVQVGVGEQVEAVWMNRKLADSAVTQHE